MILPLGAWWGIAGSVGAMLAYAVLALFYRRLAASRLAMLLFVAWILHSLALAEGLFGMLPRFGFAPALSMTVWLVLTVYLVENRLLPKLKPQWSLAGLGAAAVLLPLLFPGNNYVNIAGGVNSPWLPLHWALGIASYGLFAVAVVHGWLMLRAERAMRLAAPQDAGVPLLTLERLTFSFVKAGFVLLSATLLAGWLFGKTLYGPQYAWSWSHKTVFSVLSWLTFAALLAGRDRLGWRGPKAVHGLYLGAGLLLLGYVGSHFVLEVLLRRVA